MLGDQVHTKPETDKIHNALPANTMPGYIRPSSRPNQSADQIFVDLWARLCRTDEEMRLPDFLPNKSSPFGQSMPFR